MLVFNPIIHPCSVSFFCPIVIKIHLYHLPGTKTKDGVTVGKKKILQIRPIIVILMPETKEVLIYLP